MSSKLKQMYRPGELDPNDFSFSEAKDNKSGNGRSAFVNFDHQRVYLRLPKMRCPFGMNNGIFGDNPGAAPRYSFDLSFGDEDKMSTRTREFYEFSKMFDEATLNAAVSNSESWFDQETMTIDSARLLYSPFVKTAKNKNTGEPYPPRINVKLPQDRNGNFYAKFFDEEKKPLRGDQIFDYIERGCHIVATICVEPIWFINNRFGLKVSAHQIRVYPAQKMSGKYTFLPDEDDDEVVDDPMQVDGGDAPQDDEGDSRGVKREREEDASNSDEDEAPPKKGKKTAFAKKK